MKNLGNKQDFRVQPTFNTVSAAWNRKEAIIKRLQNIPASFSEWPGLDPLRNEK